VFNKVILDRSEPKLANVDENTFQLIPWLGFKGVQYNHPDEDPRGEYSVFLPQAKVLFMFDILLPPMPPLFSMFKSEIPPMPRSNFGNTLINGFTAMDKKLAMQSAQALLDLHVDTCVFSHGDFTYGALLKDKEAIGRAMEGLKVLL
jgi:hypothetical protein